MKSAGLHCDDARRRGLVRDARSFGLDYLEVSDDQLTLSVHCLGKAPEGLEPGNLRIDGGRRIVGIQVVAVEPLPGDPAEAADDRLEIRVDRPGDFSTYTLRLVERGRDGQATERPLPGCDPRYDRLDFSFKAACPSDLDCAAPVPCPEPHRQEPAIDYLAKDYPGFRRLLLDRLALLLPDWRERHVPDLGIALVEVLAYTGDQLSYYQDAVATEAYLDTARERISVRRHARLVDYPMHEGCNARAFVAVDTSQDIELLPGGFFFITHFDGAPPAGQPIVEQELDTVPSGSFESFEPLLPRHTPLTLRQGHSRVRIYTWGDRECCLPRGATAATLVDQRDDRQASGAGRPAPSLTRSSRAELAPPTRALDLAVGDFLALVEVKGPRTGAAADADPGHRHLVRLTSVLPGEDPLTRTPIVEIGWSADDALPIPLCISSVSQAPDCAPLDDVSVVWGNVIPVDHGRTRHDDIGTVSGEPVTACCDPCDDRGQTTAPGRYRPRVPRTPLTFAPPVPSGGSARAWRETA